MGRLPRPRSCSRRLGAAAAVGGIALLAITSARPSATAGSEPRFVVARYILTTDQDGEAPGAGQAIEAFKVNPNRWAREDIPLAVTYNPAGAPAGGDVAALIQAAAGKWSAIDAAMFSFAWAGTGSARPGPAPMARRNSTA